MSIARPVHNKKLVIILHGNTRSNKSKGYACAILEAFGMLGYILSSVAMLCFAHTNLLV
jgi:hypothetical protein